MNVFLRRALRTDVLKHYQKIASLADVYGFFFELHEPQSIRFITVYGT